MEAIHHSVRFAACGERGTERTSNTASTAFAAGNSANSRTRGGGGIIQNWFVKPLQSAIKGVVEHQAQAACSIVVLAIGGWLQVRYRRLRRRLAGPRFALASSQAESYQRILLLAIGGTGKTQLVRSLFGYSDRHKDPPNPQVSTQGLKLYTMNHEITSGDQASMCRFEIEDYRGQDITQISQHVTELSRDPKALPFTTIILMVDLFQTDEYENQDDSELPKPEFDGPDSARVDEHKGVWTRELLRTVISPLPRKLGSVFLIINKLDLLENPFSAAKLNGIRTRYQPLINVLTESIPSVRPEIILGSAAKGWGMNRLLKQLIFKAEPIP